MEIGQQKVEWSPCIFSLPCKRQYVLVVLFSVQESPESFFGLEERSGHRLVCSHVLSL